MNLKRTIEILLILLALATTAFAQGIFERQFRYADSLFKAGKYFDAITEFKRLMFFDSSGVYKFTSEMKIGLSYKAGGKENEAVKYFSLALKSARGEGEKFYAGTQIIRTLILSRKTDEALNLITQFLKTADDNQKNLLLYWRGWAFMFANRWQEAAKQFSALNENELTNLCKDVLNKKYSVNFVKGMSYIIPGAGQIYTGHYLSGLMSLGWNVLWGYTTVKAFLANRVFDGIMVGNLLWFRFYRGNFQNAEKFARQKNIEIYNDAFGYLENKFKGLKP